MPSAFSYDEMIILRLLELNSLIPHYWAEFFVLSFQLLNPQQQVILKKRLEEVEEMVLEDEKLYNIYRCKGCEAEHETKRDWFDFTSCTSCGSNDLKLIKDRQSLYDISMAMESNSDYNSFFMKYGDRISKFDIERKLILIKQYVFSVIREKSMNMRFRRFR